MIRHLRPFFLCVLIAALVGTAAATVWWLINFRSLGVSVQSVIFFFVVALIVSLLACTIVGLPVAWLLIERRLESWWIYSVTGFLVGGAISMFLLVGPPEWAIASTKSVLSDWLLGGIPGAVSGLSWWVLDRRRASPVDV
ncbi:MAG: hypothetical protein V4499_11510 [Pseudomonadota bacterium]